MANNELINLEPILEINPPASSQRVRYLCRHIFTDGRRCGSPAMRREHFCYYHHAHRKPVLKHQTFGKHPDRGLKSLDDLEDRSSVQLTLAEVLRRVASNSMDLRRAGILLYGLQIASQNMGKPPLDREPVTADIVDDPRLGHIAAPEPGRFPDSGNAMDEASRLLRQAAEAHPILHREQGEVQDEAV